MTMQTSALATFCAILLCLCALYVSSVDVTNFPRDIHDRGSRWALDSRGKLHRGKPHRHVHKREDSTIVFPPDTPKTGDCSAAHQCVSLANCLPAQKHPSGFKICKWDGLMPLVCCPADATTATTTVSSSDNASIPFRFKDPVPVDECAKESLSLDTRNRMRRSMIDQLELELGFSVEPTFNVRAGLVKDAVHPLVVGGVSVPSLEKWPFMVGIYVKTKPKNAFLCGGSLITKNTVLTAAHCFSGNLDTRSLKSDVYVIRLSSLALDTPDGIVGKTEFETSKVVVHKDFRMPALYNDIALLKFDEGVAQFTDTLRPVCLSTTDDRQSGNGGEAANIIGWGAKLSGGSLTQDLQEAKLTRVSNSECNKTYAGLPGSEHSFPHGITSEFLCAGNVETPKDACQGDSGGPLVDVDSSLTIRQIGIVSSGFECGTPGIPGIYTSVSHYREWIEENLD